MFSRRLQLDSELCVALYEVATSGEKTTIETIYRKNRIVIALVGIRIAKKIGLKILKLYVS